MNKPLLLLLTLAIFTASCSSSLKKILGKQTPHEEYAEKLRDTGLSKTPQGIQWLAASEMALLQPVNIKLPYRQHGYFHTDKARALGLAFEGRMGELISFEIDKKEPGFVLYADLYKQENNEFKHIKAVDTIDSTFELIVDEPATYVLRIQPEIDRTGRYELSMTTGPSLSYPVSGSKARIGSVWGDERDGGKRSHEGIDIFAPKKTPVVAAADGYISSVREGGIGGKTVWLRAKDRNISLYYAHLDSQMVREGEFVSKGEVVGTVGNTGNAQFTPPHLHFGIYTFGGAVDPLPFVNRETRKAPSVAAKNITEKLKLSKAIKTATGKSFQPNTIVIPLAATSNGYLAELPDGTLMTTPYSSVKRSS